MMSPKLTPPISITSPASDMGRQIISMTAREQVLASSFRPSTTTDIKHTEGHSSRSTSRKKSLPPIPQNSSSSPSFLLPPPQTGPQNTSSYDGDLYADLSTFTFGAANSQPSSSQIPLSARRDPDSPLSVHSFGQADTTPRPSVAYAYTGSGLEYSPGDERDNPANPGYLFAHKKRSAEFEFEESDPQGNSRRKHSSSGRRSSTSSSNTFGGSTASLSSPSGHSRATSASRNSSRGVMTEFSSDDDDFEHSDGAESPVDEAAELRRQRETFYHRQSNAGGSYDPGSTNRRGSAPIDIPGVSQDSVRSGLQGYGIMPDLKDDKNKGHFVANFDLNSDPYALSPSRDRESSIATLRRPSRSLDDDLRAFNAAQAQDIIEEGLVSGHSITEGTNPVSEPLSRGDWRSLAAKNGHISVDASAFEIGPLDRAPNSVPGSSREQEDALAGFDASWMQDMVGGITTMGSGDIAAQGARYPGGSKASPSLAFGKFNFGGFNPSNSDRRPSAQSWTKGWNARRPSTATVGSGTFDDPFHRHIRRFDNEYGERRSQWSFKREKADGGSATSTFNSRGSLGSGSLYSQTDHEKTLMANNKLATKASVKKTGMARGSEELWRCEYVGRFKVHRKELPPKPHSDLSKPPQQRLDIMPFADPYSKVETQSHGPPVTIHKHSRAVAFSIYRQQRPRPPPTKGRGQNASSSNLSQSRGPSSKDLLSPDRGHNRSSNIMLAPKRVQEQFTSTKSTGRLDTHGLLEDRERERDKLRIREKERPSSSSGSKSRSDKSKREEESRRSKRKSASSASQTSSAGSSRGASTASNTSNAPSTSNSVVGSQSFAKGNPPPASPPFAGSEHTHPPGKDLRSMASAKSLRSTARSIIPTKAAITKKAYQRRDSSGEDNKEENDDDDDDDFGVPAPPPKTPHSEAYGTVDVAELKRTLHHFDSSSKSSSAGSSSSFLPRWMRPSVNARKLGGPSLEGSYNAPWPMMAPQSQIEENERVVQILNESFKGVGLLPSKVPTASDLPRGGKISKLTSGTGGKLKAKSQGSSSKTAPKGTSNIFEEVPEESLYMLLPLWPGDTDPVSARADPDMSKKPHIPIQQRQYLLVYYVQDKTVKSPESEPSINLLSPTESIASSKKHHSGGPTSSSQTSSTTSVSNHDDWGVLLSAFHCSARLVGYSDLHGCGVLAPAEGLSVTGPMKEALAHMPNPSIREEHQTDFVIGVCPSRESGMEFFPEGLVKMGLCYPGLKNKPDTAEFNLGGLPEEEEEEVEDVRLSPIGRAVVEMAWLGCMALTSFGTA